METGFQRGDGGVSLSTHEFLSDRETIRMSKITCRGKPHQHPRRQFVVRKKVWGTWGGSFFEPVAEGFLKRELFIRDSGENHRSFAGFSDVVLKVLLEVQTLAEAFKGQA